MDIVNVERLREFVKRHPDAGASVRRWEAVVKESKWVSFRDVRNTFNTADYVNGKIVFDLGGNNYRMVTVADFNGQQVIIRQVMTHAEYDKDRWRR